MTLEKLLVRMTANLLRVIGQAGIVWPGGQVAARESVHRIFDKHVSAFDACGCSHVDNEALIPATWNSTAGFSSQDVTRRYHLRVFPAGLEDLANQSAQFLLMSCGQASSLAAEQLQWDLATSIRLGFGPYLFQSQPNGTIEKCHMSQPVELWHLSKHT